jgi:hypothetical protein
VILFVCELIRLFVLVSFAGPEEGGAGFPVYGAANAFFLLMALFMLLDFGRYRAYAVLYTAGKALAVAVTAGWFVFSRIQITDAVYMDGSNFIVIAGSFLYIAAADVLCGAGGAALLIRSREPAERALDGPAVPGNGGL